MKILKTIATEMVWMLWTAEGLLEDRRRGYRREFHKLLKTQNKSRGEK